MIAIDWLDKSTSGLLYLPDSERNAITDFLFLWSLYEAKILNQRGRTDAIVKAAKQWAEIGHIT